ncbi:MAG: protein translocase subunit SecF [Selenomonadales bacterium]|nr:protein translocase subunit SecF [Selenomonadales bacterium]
MKLNFDIIGKRRHFYKVSAVILVVGVVLLLTRGLNLGIDFLSGTLLEIDLKTSFTIAEVNEVVDAHLEKYQVRDVREGGQTTTLVQIRTSQTDPQKLATAIEAVSAKWKEAEHISTSSVDAVFSIELARNAFIALVLASIGMLIYIALRFEVKFAVAAVIALLHDVFVVLSIFALLRIEVNSEFVAGILAIVGYSINDTIVVFDRIRENLNKQKRQGDFEKLVNTSIMETLWRSLNTSITTLLAIGAVLLIGGVTLRPLAFALVIGIIAGTYSSIFMASSIWVDWKEAELARGAVRRA